MRKFIVFGLLTGFVIILTSCASTETARSYSPQPKSITFLDSKAFDAQVSGAMGGRASSVSVTFTGEVTTENIPERLDKWLYVLVDRYGGSYEVVNDPKLPVPKGASAVLAKLLFKTFALAGEHMRYSPAQHYNAIIYVVPGKSKITHVDFVRKTGN